jgi:hypothetical protein
MAPLGPMATARRAALLALALGGLACGREAGWPPGALLAGRSAALRELASRIALLPGTPAAREAEAFAKALPDCELVEAQAAEGSLSALRAGLRCADPSGPLAALHRERGERDLLFAWPLEAGRLTGSADLDPASDLTLAIELPDAAFHGAGALLRPSATPPGPAVLGGADALVHARLRVHGGIDLPALLSPGGQADRLFALRSQLFSAAVLDGTWELAMYLPDAGERIPRTALALGIRHRAAAEAAAALFLDEIESAWPVRRTPFALGDAAGACLAELRLLPGLAPCYLATADSFVVGWNESSVRKALDGSAAGLPASGGLVAELASFPVADARIAAPEVPFAAPALPWRRLVAEPLPAGKSIAVRLALAALAGT